MHFFQSSPPSRPPRNPARVGTPTNVGESTPDGQPSTVTLSDIVLVRRHKSTSAKIKQPPSKAVRPRVSSITLPPSKPLRPDTAPSSAPPTRLDFTLNSPRLRPTTAPKPISHPRPRPSTAPYPPSSYPRSRSGTPSAGPSSRPPNTALASLLAKKPPPPAPPTPPPPPHQHQRAISLHPQTPPPLRLRTSFSSPRPNPDKNTTPQSNASRPRPTSAYIPATVSKQTHAATKAFRSPAAIPAPKQKSQPPQFSTADRTILEELKRTISAKAAQFVVKGISHGGMAGSMSMGRRGGGRHHPFPKEEVPYPRCYEREAVDLDVWETSFCEQICDSVTWHIFEEPPTKVLDIGSGTGTWILNCARLWKRCHFVGLDIVPLHPDLQQVGSSDLAARITWVQENFLNGLPFPNEEFDFVHIKRIARGVPEDKWDSLFEEITRVMKPGGAFEMVEEDLFFPGKDPDSDGESSQTDFEFQSCVNLNDEDTDNTLTNSSASEYAATTPVKIAGPTIASVAAFPLVTASLSAVTLLPAATRPNTAPGRQKFGRPEVKPPSQPRPVSRSPSLQLPGRMQPFPKSKHPAQGYGSFQLHGPSQSEFALSTASLSSPGSESPHVPARPSTSSSLTMVSRPTVATHAGPHSSKTPTDKPLQDPQDLLMTLPRPPSNPRDHRLLETIYTEMHAARFINLSPLSILANTLGLYFKDVRTHLPLQFTFPPRSKPRDYLSKYSGYDSDSSDSDDARHALHNPNSPGALDQIDSPWLSRLDLIEHTSPYVHLDNTCLSALMPFPKAQSPSGGTARGSPPPPQSTTTDGKLSPSGSPNSMLPNAGMRWAASRLPNRTVHLDLRTLNLHLALRTADTLACAEAMWEWVTDYQAAQAKNGTAEEARAQSGSVDGQTTAVADAIRSAINTLTRADFDTLLTKFDLDMRDHMGLEPAMKERFAWSVFPSSPTTERKVFDTACGKWEHWELERQQQRSRQRHTDNGLTDHAEPPNGASHVPIVERRSSPRAGPTCGNSIPDRRLSRVLRVFVAWKAT